LVVAVEKPSEASALAETVITPSPSRGREADAQAPLFFSRDLAAFRINQVYEAAGQTGDRLIAAFILAVIGYPALNVLAGGGATIEECSHGPS
jgi:hypothetical protein